MSELVSIIIPNFNKGRYITQTLLSALNQSYSNIELVVVDDGSTDDSIAILDGLCALHKNITFIKRENKPSGGSACRNIGIENAKGDFILFLDSDDLITSTCIENRLQEIKQESLDFMVFNTGTFNKDIGDSSLHWMVPKGNHLRMFLSHDLPWNISSVLWSKSALLSIEGFQENFVRLQDVELHTRALIHKLTYKVSENKEFGFYYRIDPSRNSLDEESVIVNKVKGVSIYLSYFKDTLIEDKKYLKGTAISIYRDVLQFYKGKAIENKLLRALIAKIFRTNTKTEKVVLLIYTKLFSLGFSKIKGFNFLFKKIFIYL